MRRHFSSHPGQTLTELLVVLGVVGLILGVTGSFLRTGKVITQVQRSAEKFASDLRRVQDIAYLYQKYDNGYPCGYGIQLKSDGSGYWIVVATSDPAFNPDPPNPIKCTPTTTMMFIEATKFADYQFSFDTGVRVVPVPPGAADTVYFMPPEPTTHFHFIGIPTDPNVASFMIRMGETALAVSVNTFGGVTVNTSAFMPTATPTSAPTPICVNGETKCELTFLCAGAGSHGIFTCLNGSWSPPSCTNSCP